MRISLDSVPMWARFVLTAVAAVIATAFGWGVALGGHRAALADAARTAQEASASMKDLDARMIEIEAYRREHDVLEAAELEAIEGLRQGLEKVNDKLDALAEAISRIEGRLER